MAVRVAFLALLSTCAFTLAYTPEAGASIRACRTALAIPHFGGTEQDLAAIAKDFLLKNISPAGTVPGTVVAAPALNPGDPNYRFHWVRDAALTMDLVRELALHAQGEEKTALEKRMFDYMELSHRHQTMPNRAGGLGEVRFNVDGTIDQSDWMRPQNDGPALRALTLARFAANLMDSGRENIVREKLYDESPLSLIKRDLEYVAANWMKPSYDLWEEVLGSNFNTLAAMRASLIEGANLAQRLGDGGASDYYRRTAREISASMERFWNPERGYIVAALNQQHGTGAGRSGLDVSSLLTVLHSPAPGESFGVTDDRMIATVHSLIMAFRGLYAINNRPELATLGEAIGRNPEDPYDGWNVGKKGNPWFLATNGTAQFHYLLETALRKRGEIKLTVLNIPFFSSLPGMQGQHLAAGMTLHPGDARFASILNALTVRGDSFIARSIYHTAHDGHMSEQFNRDSGYMTGAPDLTWSYDSYLTALFARPSH